jgi:multidrug efflux pump subunit AcrA (membrane-fusion protein)
MSAASPGIGRRWVLPIIRIIVFAAIGAALIKLAFFSGATSGSDGVKPTGAISDPIATVATGSIKNDVSVDATVYPDAAVPVRATVAGEITKVSIALGAGAAGNTAVVVVKHPLTSTDPAATPGFRSVTITAGVAGTVSALDALVGQQVNVGDVLAQIAPPTFNVSGSIAPVDQYRLLSKPTEATVTIAGGPAPFTCTGLTISAPLAGAGSTGGGSAGSAGAADGGSGAGAPGGGAGSSGGPTVRCAVPGDVTVFAGLAAKLKISAGSAADAMIVPATAVEGSGAAGTVYEPSANGGAPTPVKVQLGIFDGRNVQIVSGLKKGDRILEFVPSKADQQAAQATGLGG